MACASGIWPRLGCGRYRLACMKKHLAALLALLALLVPALAAETVATSAAAASSASLPDIEDEVMCPTCGVALNQAFSPQAERERDFIRAEIAKGRSKDQIKQALVNEFGRRVLATPQTDDSSFNWTAYLVPIAAILAAAVALVLGLNRWRVRPAGGTDAPASELSPDDAARLERDLSKYDV
jgi:cytochrome c-type biogenesis protein CcmH